MHRRLALFLPFALFLGVALVLGVGLLRGRARDLPPDRVRPFPTFALRSVTDGAPGLSNADLRGKVSLVNVFASWCASCAVEAPLLKSIAESRQATLYGLAWQDAPEKTREWLTRYGDPFAAIGADTTGALGTDLGVTGAPESFVVDKQGRIRLHVPGVIDERLYAETLAPLIQRLNAEPG